jgi:iron complex outermembrane receptor protein
VPKVEAEDLTRLNTTLSPSLRVLFASNPITDTFSGQAFFKPDDVPDIDHVGLERESWRVSLTGDWRPEALGGHAITMITGYNEMGANWIRDFDLTESQNWLSQDPQRHEDFTFELRLTSPQEQRLRYSVGANYFDVDFIQEGNGGAAVWAYDGGLSFAGIPGPIVLFQSSIPEEGGTTRAIFGSVGIDIFEQLTLDLEARWQEDVVSNDNPDTPIVDFKEDFTSFLPRATLSFKPVEPTTIWFTYAEGNLPGFFNSDAVGLSEAELQQIRDQIGEANLFNDEEELKSYELGWKQQTMEDRIFFSLVGYYMEWDNQKTRQAVAITTDEGDPFIANIQTNAGSSELWGIEFESVMTLTERLSAQLSLNWAQGEYDSFRCGFAPFLPEPKDCSGNTPPRYPEWSGAVSLMWQDQLTGEWDYFARWDSSYFGKAFTDESNFAWFGEYWLTNLRGGVSKDKLRIEAYVTNLFDEDDYPAVARWSDFSTPALFGFVSNQGLAITPPEKRRIGLRFIFDF